MSDEITTVENEEQNVAKQGYSNEAYQSLSLRYSVDKYSLLMEVREGKKPKSALIDDAKEFLEQFGTGLGVTEENEDELIDAILDNFLGYGILTDLIEDDTVSDINIIGSKSIIIKRKGKRMMSGIEFPSENAYQRFIDTLCTKNKVNTSTRHATSRFTDNLTSDRAILRFSLVTPFLTTDKSYKVYIRKTLKDFPEIEDLIKEEMLDERIAKRLIDNFSEASILICGGVSSGKTTLLNALKEKIPNDKMALVIQQAEELTSKGGKMMTFLHTVEGSMESDVRYDLEELSTLGLTLDTDYFIVGEIKGAETTHIMKCSNTGGICAGTIHSNSPEEALDRMVDFSLHARGNAYTKPELMDMLKLFRTIVYMKNFKVQRISEVRGITDGKIEYECIYDRKLGIDKLD